MKTIKEIFKDYPTPIEWLYYDGHEDTYVVYGTTSYESTLRGDNKVLGYIEYFNFTVYSKSNYNDLIEDIKNKLQENGYMWMPERSSGDNFHEETGLYYKTLCFAIEREEI